MLDLLFCVCFFLLVLMVLYLLTFWYALALLTIIVYKCVQISVRTLSTTSCLFIFTVKIQICGTKFLSHFFCEIILIEINLKHVALLLLLNKPYLSATDDLFLVFEKSELFFTGEFIVFYLLVWFTEIKIRCQADCQLDCPVVVCLLDCQNDHHRCLIWPNMTNWSDTFMMHGTR